MVDWITGAIQEHSCGWIRNSVFAPCFVMCLTRGSTKIFQIMPHTLCKNGHNWYWTWPIEKEGILEKASHSEWADSIVTVYKKDGKYRICGDYKVTINQALDIDLYPLPNPTEFSYRQAQVYLRKVYVWCNAMSNIVFVHNNWSTTNFICRYYNNYAYCSN